MYKVVVFILVICSLSCTKGDETQVTTTETRSELSENDLKHVFLQGSYWIYAEEGGDRIDSHVVINSEKKSGEQTYGGHGASGKHLYEYVEMSISYSLNKKEQKWFLTSSGNIGAYLPYSGPPQYKMVSPNSVPSHNGTYITDSNISVLYGGVEYSDLYKIEISKGPSLAHYFYFPTTILFYNSKYGIVKFISPENEGEEPKTWNLIRSKTIKE